MYKDLKILRDIVNQGFKIFSIDQARTAAKNLKIDESSIPNVLRNLKNNGWIESVKKGVYAITSDSGFGPVPHEFEIAMALVKEGAISHWTALHFHHLTQQIPRTVFVLVPTKTSIPDKINPMYRFVFTSKDNYFGIEKIWIGESKVKITDSERTLLDGLMRPKYCGDFLEVLHAFKLHLEKLNLEKIISYALKLDTSTIKRLGWVLDYLGVSNDKIKILEKVESKGYRKLDPTGKEKGIYNRKWMILENII